MVRLEMSRAWLRQGGSLVLATTPGEDMARALDKAIGAAGSFRVLRHAATEERRSHPLHALAGLLSTVGETELGRLTGPHRSVLSGALCRRTPGPQPPRLLGEAVLSLVGTLARTGSVLLVVEGAHWLDEVSAQVLQFVASQAPGLTIQAAVATEASDEGIQAARQLCPPPLLVVLG